MGPEYSKLKKIAEDLDLDLNDKVTFTGYVSDEDKFKLLKKAYIYYQVS